MGWADERKTTSDQKLALWRAEAVVRSTGQTPAFGEVSDLYATHFRTW